VYVAWWPAVARIPPERVRVRFLVRRNDDAGVSAERHRGENGEKSEQVRVGIVVGNVRAAHRSGADRQAISVGKGLGAARLVRSDVERDQVELRVEHRVVDQQRRQQREKVRANIVYAKQPTRRELQPA